MNILFLIKSYCTHDRQNALCVESIVECMKKIDNKITVDYLSWEYKQSINDDQNVYTLYIPENKGIVKKFQANLYKFINMPIGNKKVVNCFSRRIKELMNKNNYDAIISVINPPEVAEALYRVKKYNPHIKFILYEIDPNSNRYKGDLSCFEKIWTKKSINWEKKIYSLADKIIHMNTHKKHFSSNIFTSFKEKTFYLDIPSFQIDTQNIRGIEKNEKLKLLYGGAFYHKLREPDYMIDLFSKLSQNYEIQLDIYTGQSLRSKMEELAKKNSFINLHDEVCEDVLNKEIEKSDILISVGNNNSDYLPSKTLKYMSKGKPIIHFYSDELDVSLNYYKYYPAIMLIDQREEINEDIIKSINAFIDNVKKGYNIDFNLLEKKLIENTPMYSAQKILEIIDE